MCQRLILGVLKTLNYIKCIQFCPSQKIGSRVHVNNGQVCYVGIHVPCWFAAPINSSFTISSSFVSV
uniref:Uncharacterized protein n=1 Tax=Macaca fascicularis TaxID=9541 RepID=A0A7N9CPX5_MACFA